MQHNTPSGHTGERGPRGPGRHTRNTTHRADTPVNGSQVAQDTADTISIFELLRQENCISRLCAPDSL